MTLRVVFMGTPDFAVPTLSEIIGQGHEVVACYTRAPKPAGRGLDIQKSPVHRLAEQFGIPILTPKSLRTEEAASTFRAHQADVAVVVAYGLILPTSILEAPRLGCLNLHGSLLPRWRGAAPIQRAVMAGDAQSGVMVMRMDEDLDTGPIGMAETIPIEPDMTAGDLHDKLMVIGADLMVRALAGLERGALQFRRQPDEGATYAAKISKEEARIDWQAPAREVHDRIRGLSPFPGAFTVFDPGQEPTRLKILRSRLVAGDGKAGEVLDDAGTIACGDGAIRLIEVQRAGKGPMKAGDFLRGAKIRRGFRLA